MEDQVPDQEAVRVSDRGEKKNWKSMLHKNKRADCLKLNPLKLAVHGSFSAKRRCNGQAAVLALKSTSIVVKSVTSTPTLGPQNIWTRRYTKTKYYQKTCGNLSNKWKFGVQIWNSDEKMWGPW